MNEVKVLNLEGLNCFLNNLKTLFATKSELDEHSNIHAPDDAEKNIIVGIKKNGTELEVDSERKVNINVDESVQSDWNQNDENASDYVKNRTHYKTFVLDKIDEYTVECNTTGGNNSYTCEIDGIETYTSYDIVVDWDGIQYSFNADSSVNAIGNPYLKSTDNEDNGMPFYIEYGGFIIESMTWSSSTVYASTNGTHTLIRYKNATEYKTLDEKYIPDCIVKKTDTSIAIGEDSTTTNGISIGRICNSLYGGIAMGHMCESIGSGTVTLGRNNTTNKGLVSIGEYIDNTYGCAIGSHLITNDETNKSYITFGKYNLLDGDYLLSIGNGISSCGLSNAHTLDENGNAWYAGSIEGTYLILKSSTENSTKRFQISINDNGEISATEIT